MIEGQQNLSRLKQERHGGQQTSQDRLLQTVLPFASKWACFARFTQEGSYYYAHTRPDETKDFVTVIFKSPNLHLLNAALPLVSCDLPRLFTECPLAYRRVSPPLARAGLLGFRIHLRHRVFWLAMKSGHFSSQKGACCSLSLFFSTTSFLVLTPNHCDFHLTSFHQECPSQCLQYLSRTRAQSFTHRSFR